MWQKGTKQTRDKYVYCLNLEREREDVTSQTSMASWLVPFLPCWVNKDANCVEPLRKILSGILWSGSFLQYSKEELLDPSLFLELFFLFLNAEEEGEFGCGLLLSEEKQDPILLRIEKMHSRPPKQPHQHPHPPLSSSSSLDGSVTTPLEENTHTHTHTNSQTKINSFS